MTNKAAGEHDSHLLSSRNSTVAELERDLELERRKVRDLQEGSRERDKEYQKLKVLLYNPRLGTPSSFLHYRRNTIKSNEKRCWARTTLTKSLAKNQVLHSAARINQVDSKTIRTSRNRLAGMERTSVQF